MAKKHVKVIEHLAGLLKDIGVATWGLLGFGAVQKMLNGTALTLSDVGFAVLGAVLFVTFNAVALWLLKEE